MSATIKRPRPLRTHDGIDVIAGETVYAWDGRTLVEAVVEGDGEHVCWVYHDRCFYLRASAVAYRIAQLRKQIDDDTAEIERLEHTA